jgi:predicted regulator of Ras-like GTPase activity (Roadblock/LC7/MglB family)
MNPESLVLHESEYKRIRSILAKMQTDLSADLVLLINRSGQQIACEGTANDLDLTSLASLAAANIAATNGLAQIIGEREFSVLYHQGRHRSIHISDLSKQFSLVLLFDESVLLGKVRWKVKRATESIEEVFKKFQEEMEYKPPSVEESGNASRLFTDEDMEKFLGH